MPLCLVSLAPGPLVDFVDVLSSIDFSNSDTFNIKEHSQLYQTLGFPHAVSLHNVFTKLFDLQEKVGEVHLARVRDHALMEHFQFSKSNCSIRQKTDFLRDGAKGSIMVRWQDLFFPNERSLPYLDHLVHEIVTKSPSSLSRVSAVNILVRAILTT